MKFIASCLTFLIAAGAPSPTFAYLKFGVRVTSGEVVDVKWTRTIEYFVTERDIPEVSASQLRDVVTRAFATWQSAPNTSLQSQFQGFTIAPPVLRDQRTTFGFLDRPDLDRVLGATSFLIDATSGEIVESDVFFNTRFTWSVAPSGTVGRIDLESVALHEIGHLLGLGHSALGETEMIPGGRRVVATGAVMFPIAMSPGATADRQLQPDDLAGIADIYASGSFNSATSSISGRITKDGRGVFGAHVVAANLATGVLVGGFTLNNEGDYVIAGIDPGVYVVRVEPLDDADIESFFNDSADIEFRVTYGSRVVVAPEGGGSDRMDIQVTPK